MSGPTFGLPGTGSNSARSVSHMRKRPYTFKLIKTSQTVSDPSEGSAKDGLFRVTLVPGGTDIRSYKASVYLYREPLDAALTVGKWKRRESGSTTVGCLAYGNGIYMAGVANGSIVTSQDGINWSAPVPVSLSMTSVTSIAFGNGVFVAVGANNSASVIATSVDGITWTTRTNGFSSYASKVIFANGIFVALGGATLGQLATSTNGTSWTLRTTNLGTGRLNSIAYGNGIFVVVGDSSRIATSPDGITWTSRTGSIDASGHPVVFDGTKFLLYTDKLLTSTDGITWTSQNFADGVASLVGSRDMIYANGIFISNRASGIAVNVSSDGLNWTSVSMGNIGGSASCVGYGNGVFLVGHNAGSIWTCSAWPIDVTVGINGGTTSFDSVFTSVANTANQTDVVSDRLMMESSEVMTTGRWTDKAYGDVNTPGACLIEWESK